MNKREEITLTSVVKRNPDLLFSKMDNEVVMLSTENSEYYGLNSVGSRIWEMMEQPVNVDKIIGKLLKEYDVERQQAETDILLLMAELKSKKILHLVHE